MKFLIIFVSFLYVTECFENNIGRNILGSLPKELIEKIHNGIQNPKGGQITADVTEFAEQVINNIDTYMVEHAMDPASLPSTKLSLSVGGYINLTNGWLSDISTMDKNDNVTVTYISSNRTLIVDLPLKFDQMKFAYDYLAHVVLVNINGKINGTINDVKAHVVIRFDFKAVKAYLDTFDIRDTGSIHITFSGNGLVDWIIDLLSDVVTVFLHPVIIEIAQGIVKNIMNSIVDSVNQFLDEILQRNTTMIQYN